MKLLLTFSVIAAPLAAQAQDRPIMDRAEFVALVEGRSLTQRLLGVALRVGGDGRITGAAMGGDVTGVWDWQNGHFCREMAWGDRRFARDCQTVTLDGDLVTFTADRGRGDTATLRIR